jgi:hypothetical protein
MKIRCLIGLIFLFMASLGNLYAQIEEGVENGTENRDQGRDGLFDEGNKNTFRVLFSGNPGRAALYSLIVPGGGQLYNKRYWKIPIVYGGLGAVGYMLYNAEMNFRTEKDEYINSIGTGSQQSNFNYYQQAKKSREQAIFAVIGVYLFNVFDAYIDRHLIDFDMSDDLSFKISPYGDGISPVGLSLAYNLNQ